MITGHYIRYMRINEHIIYYKRISVESKPEKWNLGQVTMNKGSN